MKTVKTLHFKLKSNVKFKVPINCYKMQLARVYSKLDPLKQKVNVWSNFARKSMWDGLWKVINKLT